MAGAGAGGGIGADTETPSKRDRLTTRTARDVTPEATSAATRHPNNFAQAKQAALASPASAKKRPVLGEYHDGSFGTYMGHKIEKLRLQQRGGGRAWDDATADSELAETAAIDIVAAHLFRGCHVYVNGQTTPSKTDIRRILVAGGGVYEQYETHMVTHIVASTLSVATAKMYRKKVKRPPIVYPSWITDSVSAGKLMDPADYELKEMQEAGQLAISRHFLSSSGSSHRTSPARSGSSVSPARPRLPAQAGGRDRSATDQGRGSAADDHEGESVEEENKRLAAQLAAAAAAPATTVTEAMLHPKTTGRNPRTFLKSYYESSRLHYIGSWRLRVPELARAAQLEAQQRRRDGRVQPSATGSSVRSSGARSESPSPMRRRDIDGRTDECDAGGDRDQAGGERAKRRAPQIVHIDMDCFFVSVALRDHPELIDKPCVVAHSGAMPNVGPGGHRGGEISSANYPARALGVKAGMGVVRAQDMCREGGSQLHVLPYNFRGFENVSKTVYRLFYEAADAVEIVSTDEAYLDMSSAEDVWEAVKRLRDAIEEQTQCTASAGIGFNKLIARLATYRAKPNNQFRVTVDDYLPYMASLSLRQLPHFGPRTARKLEARGITTVVEAQSVPVEDLQAWFGDQLGEKLFEVAHGRGAVHLDPPKLPMTVSARIGWGVRFKPGDEEGTETFIRTVAEEVADRLRKARCAGKKVVLSVLKRREGAPESGKFLGAGSCDSFSKSVLLTTAVSGERRLAAEVLGLWRALHFDVSQLRGVDVQVGKLVERSAEETERDNELAVTLRDQSVASMFATHAAVEQGSEDPHTPEETQFRAAAGGVPQNGGAAPVSSPEFEWESEPAGRDVSALRSSQTSTDHGKSASEGGSPASATRRRVRFSGPEVDGGGSGGHGAGAAAGSAGGMAVVTDTTRRLSRQDLDPSFSQIDESALNELGPSVVSELLAERARRPRAAEQSGKQLSSQDFNPTMSQVDPEVLRDLPEDLRAEIEGQRHRNRDGGTVDAVAPLEVSRVPPAEKRRAGPATAGDAKKPRVHVPGQFTMTQIVGGHNPVEDVEGIGEMSLLAQRQLLNNLGYGSQVDAEALRKAQEAELGRVQAGPPAASEKPATVRPPKQVVKDLFGAQSVEKPLYAPPFARETNRNELRTALREWVKAIDAPAMEHAGLVVAFAVHLAHNKDLESVAWLLRTMRRVCGGLAAWKAVLAAVEQRVGTAVKALYGYTIMW